MASDFKDTNIFSLDIVQQIIDYVENNLFEELTPSMIAAHFFVSVSTLSSAFKIVCGMTVMEYIRNRRLTSKVFLPLRVKVSIQGGWDTIKLTKSDCAGQDFSFPFYYNAFISDKGGNQMENLEISCQIDTGTMQFKKEWEILYSLTGNLLKEHIPFKVDGKTMIFAHGLEFPLDKICLTFKWKDEETVKCFFSSDTETKHMEKGFKYFDVIYEEMKVRCMFYGDCVGADTDEFLYKNTDLVQINDSLVPVQSLEFYYENAEKNSIYYKMVEERLKRYGNEETVTYRC